MYILLLLLFINHTLNRAIRGVENLPISDILPKAFLIYSAKFTHK